MTPAEFTRQTAHIPYQPRGVFFSELFLFSVTCLTAGVTAIVESGVHAGVSTRVLRTLFPRVTSFEWNASVIPNDLRDVVVVADGQIAVPEWIAAHPAEQIAVFLDGPKGPRGTAVRERCLTSPNVRVVGQHDSPLGSGETIHSRRSADLGLDANVPLDIMAWSKRANRPGLGISVNP